VRQRCVSFCVVPAWLLVGSNAYDTLPLASASPTWELLCQIVDPKTKLLESSDMNTSTENDDVCCYGGGPFTSAIRNIRSGASFWRPATSMILAKSDPDSDEQADLVAPEVLELWRTVGCDIDKNQNGTQRSATEIAES
jgi:hypothetical protein